MKTYDAMKTMIVLVSVVTLSAAFLLVSCDQESQSPNSSTIPLEPSEPERHEELTNFYTSRGLGMNGQIGANLRPGKFVLNLPAGDWRVTYTMPDGGRYSKYVVLDEETMCYFGTNSEKVVSVEVEQGDFTDDGTAVPFGSHLYHSGGMFRGWGVIVIVILNGDVNTAGSGGFMIVLIDEDTAFPPESTPTPKPSGNGGGGNGGGGGGTPTAPTINATFTWTDKDNPQYDIHIFNGTTTCGATPDASGVGDAGTDTAQITGHATNFSTNYAICIDKPGNGQINDSTVDITTSDGGADTCNGSGNISGSDDDFQKIGEVNVDAAGNSTVTATCLP